MRYLVTGATGFIGGRLVAQLRAAGHDLVLLVRSPERAAHLAVEGVTLVRGDVTDGDSVGAAMAGADGVFHLAAWYEIGARDASMAQAINVDGTRNVLLAMKRLGIAKGVYTSSLAVFSDTRGVLVDEAYRFEGRHLSEYDRTKWLAHHGVAEPLMGAGLPLVIVQPGVVYGPGDTSGIGRALRRYLQRTLPLAPKRTSFCWAHVDDVAHAHVLAMERGRVGESYIVAGEERTFVEALALAERLTGIRAPRWHPGPLAMRAMAALLTPLALALKLPEDYQPESLRVVAGTTYIGSNAKARRELGYDPRPLEAGLRQTLEHEMRKLGMPEVAPATRA